MKRVVLYLMIPVFFAACGCARQVLMDETTRSQVETILTEVQAYMNRAARDRGCALLFSSELGKQSKTLDERARADIEVALSKSYEAYNLEPGWAPTNHAIAVCELYLGNNDKAIKYARRALSFSQDLDRMQAWIVIGAAHAAKAQRETDSSKRKREYEKAISAYEMFVQKCPEHMGVPYIKTTIEVMKEEIEKSR